VKQIVTRGIVLSRTDFGEADRIITILTPDQGKLRLMAKGVRKVKSKLAGGIELFSVSHITYMPGKGEVGTLISTRLIDHYGNIVRNIDRVQLGYDLIKQLNKATEDEPEASYFHLLETAFQALDNNEIDAGLIKTWYQAQLLKLAGHAPNLQTDTAGNKLQENQKYNFDFDEMSFSPQPNGRFSAGHIKVLRLCFSQHDPQMIHKVDGAGNLIPKIQPVIKTISDLYLQR
jgi:DNA repair protein RecO (recombination protein O)